MGCKMSEEEEQKIINLLAVNGFELLDDSNQDDDIDEVSDDWDN